MNLKTSHEFSVWNPEKGDLPKFETHIFEFSYPISRTSARDIIERIEGFIIEKKKREPK